MDNTHDDKDTASTNLENPGRRRLLKFLAVGGAVTAVSMLPGKWSSPTIKTGVLPAHAQVTPGRYQVSCSPSIILEEDEVNVLYTFSADTWENPSTDPLVGVVMKATLNVDGHLTVQTQSTDVNGEAFFAINDVFPQQTDAVATVEFNDPATYGNDQCQTFYRIQIPS